MHEERESMDKVVCCPELARSESCDSISIKYRLPFRLEKAHEHPEVEVVLHFRLTRCTGELALGDIAYTTTLLPGERVRLSSSDRHTRFSYDSETQQVNRLETTSEEAMFMLGMARATSDLTIVDESAYSTAAGGSHTTGGGGASVDLLIFQAGGGASHGSYNAWSAGEFARNVTQHAEASSMHVEAGVRAASYTAISEVAQRQHVEGESESHMESSTRLFSNPNRCHAVTFFFYKVDKLQRLTYDLVLVERRVVDDSAPTGVDLAPRGPASKVAVARAVIPADHPDRLEIERRDRDSLKAGMWKRDEGPLSGAPVHMRVRPTTRPSVPAPSGDHRRELLEAVDLELARAGLLDEQRREVTDEVRARFHWERTIRLPTAGIIVKGCLDECCIAEPELKRQIELEQERAALQNELLKKQIELLEKSREYRCCPDGEVEPSDA